MSVDSRLGERAEAVLHHGWEWEDTMATGNRLRPHRCAARRMAERVAAQVAESLERRVFLDGLSLAARVDYAVGVTPVSIAVGDLNSDGYGDLITTNVDGNSISVLLASGDGTFAAKVDYAAGVSPQDVAVGDFNGDGHPDLAVGSYRANQVNILLGHGDGTFATNVDYAGINVKDVAVADINGDGASDLVTSTTDSVNLMLGRGDGTFGAAVAFVAGKWNSSVVTGDLNGDRYSDVVATGGDVLTVLLGLESGAFAPKVDYLLRHGHDIEDVAIADFNRDGHSDLVTANGPAGSVSVLLGRGDGTFGPEVDYAAGMAPRSLAVGDLDGDGQIDAVTGNAPGDDVRVVLGQGDGAFVMGASLEAGMRVVVGDFNGDGRSDLATANSSDNSVSVLLNTGSQTNRAPVDIALSATTVTEKQPVGTVVGTLSGSDRDPGQEQTLAFTLFSGYGDGALFNIDGATRELRTAAIFDSAANRSYRIKVRATDTGSPALSYEEVFTITVTDAPETVGEFGQVNGKAASLTTVVDGDTISVKLAGGGSGVLDASGVITLTNTTVRSVLSIAARKGATGDGAYVLKGIVCPGPLKSISAKSVVLGGVAELGSAVAPGQGSTSIQFQQISDGSIEMPNLGLTSLRLLNWSDAGGDADELEANWIGSITVSGRKDSRTTPQVNEMLPGDLGADVVAIAAKRGVAISRVTVAGGLTGTDVWAAGTIGSLSAKGSLLNTRIGALGAIGSISAAAMQGSDILVGMSQGFDGRFAGSAGDFVNAEAKLSRLSVTGMKLPRGSVHPAYVVDSHVSAPRFGTVTLTNVPEGTSEMLHVITDTGTLYVKKLSEGMIGAGKWRGPAAGRPGVVEGLG